MPREAPSEEQGAFGFDEAEMCLKVAPHAGALLGAGKL
jgi:hypothetical protein